MSPDPDDVLKKKLFLLVAAIFGFLCLVPLTVGYESFLTGLVGMAPFFGAIIFLKQKSTLKKEPDDE